MSHQWMDRLDGVEIENASTQDVTRETVNQYLSNVVAVDSFTVCNTASSECSSNCRGEKMADVNKAPWTSQEDEKLAWLVMQRGTKSWTELAKLHSSRSGKQCRERWINCLNPEITKSAWSNDENVLLLQLHEKLGNHWAEIAKYLPGRSDNAIKNHYHTIVKQKSLTEDPVAMDAFRAPDSLLYCTPSQNGGLVGAQPVRLFNTPTTMVSVRSNGEDCAKVTQLQHTESKVLFSPPAKVQRLDSDISFSPSNISFLSDINCGDETSLKDLSSLYEMLGETPKMATPLQPASVRKRRSLDFQLGDKPIGALELCSSAGDSDHIGVSTIASATTTPMSVSLTIKSQQAKTPCILRRRRRKLYSSGSGKKYSVVRSTKSSAIAPSADSPAVDTAESNTVANTTPKKEHSEHILPFSPSQFLNLEMSCSAVTSTPLSTKERRSLFGANKPDGVDAISHSLSVLQAPNETPLKHMMPLVQSIRGKDRSHVLLSPESPETACTGETLPFRSYCSNRSDTRNNPQSNTVGGDRLRRQLSSHWTLIGDMAFIESQIETPSKSLIGEHSVGLSPSSIMHCETLIGSWDEPSVQDADIPPLTMSQSSASTSAHGLDWARVACGRTSTQLELINRAREFVHSARSQHQTLTQ